MKKDVMLLLAILTLSGCSANKQVEQSFSFEKEPNSGVVILGMEEEIPNATSISYLFRRWSNDNNDLEHKIPGKLYRVEVANGIFYTKIENMPNFFMKPLDAGTYTLAEMDITFAGGRKGSVCFSGGSVVFNVNPKELIYIGNIHPSTESFTKKSGSISVVRWPKDANLTSFNHKFSTKKEISEYLSSYPGLAESNVVYASNTMISFTLGKDMFGNKICRGAF